MIAYEKHAALLEKILPSIVEHVRRNEIPKLEIDSGPTAEHYIASTSCEEFVDELSDAIFYALVKADALNRF
jgi:hypothetical protein